MSTRTRDDWILWGSVGCALVGTAHSEWSLAVAVGAHPWVAAVVPGALDLYVVRALRTHRDVFVAVLAMVAANVSWYLVHSGDLPVGWQLRSAVGAIAPLVLWRVHSLKYTRTRKELLWGLDAGAVSAPAEYTAPETAPAPNVYSGALPDPGFNASECTHGGFCRDANGVQCIPCPEPAPDRVPDWMADEYPPSAPDVVHLSTAALDEWADKWEPFPVSESAPVPHLRPVPDLPAEYAPDLNPGDGGYVALAQEYIATTDAPSVRGLKAHAGVGQARAERLLKHLGVRS